MQLVSVHIAVLAVGKDAAPTQVITELATAAGHEIVARVTVTDNQSAVRAQLARWIDDTNIDVVIVSGGVESESTSSAMKPLVTQTLPGFTDLFRYLAFQEIGASAMLSNAEAAQCNQTFVFVLPAAAGAVKAAMEKLILPQLDSRTTPKNLVTQMPRLRGGDDAVPMPVAIEKTAGGSGLTPKAPAAPTVRRERPRTGANIISRGQQAFDPPTKPIDVARLEQQIALSEGSSQTKKVDLSKLPKLPPGAELPDDTVTDAKAARPARLESSPIDPPAPAPAPAKPWTPPKRSSPTVPPVIPPIGKKPVVATPSPAAPPAPPPAASAPAEESLDDAVENALLEEAVDKALDEAAPAAPSPAPQTAAKSEPVRRPPTEPPPPPAKRSPTTPPAKRPPTTPPPAPPRAQTPAVATPVVPEPVAPAAAAAAAIDAAIDSAPEPKPAQAKPASAQSPPKPESTNLVDLTGGTFDYPTKKSGSKVGWILAALAMATLGFVAVVVLFPSSSSSSASSSTPPAAPETPSQIAAAPMPDAAVAEPAAAPETEPAIEMDPQPVQKPVRGTTPTRPTRPTTDPKPPVSDQAVTKPTRDPEPTPEPEPEAPDAPPITSSDCDEVACVLAKYDRPCCEKYRPAESDIKPRATGGVPTELDKVMVRAGVEKVKPRVVKCGETSGDKGTVKIAVTVTPNGTVSDASVAESPTPTLGECVAAAMRKATFGKSVNGGSFTYPFVF